MDANFVKAQPVSTRKKTRKAFSLSLGEDVIHHAPLFENSELITLVKPSTAGVDLSSWIALNQDFLLEKIHKHGGVLFRGFGLANDNDFQNFIGTLPFEPVDAANFEESTPRQKIADGIYTTTSFPCEEAIALHSDYTPSMILANKICFFCMLPSHTGGQTPFADNRKILQRLHPDVSDKFRKLGWTLVRNYGNGLGLSWEDTFNGQNKAEIERHCQEKQIDVSWSGKVMRTRQTRSAIMHHPITNEECWFNHISFWHVANLPDEVRETMLSQVGYEGLPFNTYYGDGSEISTEVAHHIRDVLLQEKKIFPWQQGDVLVADNILTSHGREPFSGDRVVRVSLFDKLIRPAFAAGI